MCQFQFPTPLPHPAYIPVMIVCWHNSFISFASRRLEVLARDAPQRPWEPGGKRKLRRHTRPLRRSRRTVTPRLRLLPHKVPDHLQRQLVRDEPPVRGVSERHGHQRGKQHRDLRRGAVVLKGQVGQSLHERGRSAPAQHVLVRGTQQRERADEEDGLVQKVLELGGGGARVIAASLARRV